MKPMGVIPGLITLGNAVCGFTAIYKIAMAQAQPNPLLLAQAQPNPLLAHPHYVQAAWLILLAMIFDAFDGKVARLTKQTSDFGAQLDSLSDLVSFGIAPAILVAAMNWPAPGVWSKATWFFCLVFALCTILRLARFNVEGRKKAKDADWFKGLPSPAAAGTIATLVILSHFMIDKHEGSRLGLLSDDMAQQLSALIVRVGLPAMALLLGYLMVSSRIQYAHIFNRYVSGKRTFEYFTGLIVVVLLLAAIREIALAVGFLAFLVSGPLRLLRRREEPEVSLEAAPAEPRRPSRRS